MPTKAAGTLYIAEKPSLAKAVAEGLGVLKRQKGWFECRNDTKVTWCFGHLLELAEPDDYLPDDLPKTKKGKKMWRLRDLPILPSTWRSNVRADKGVKAQLSVIGKLLKEAAVVVHAGDPDREGQLLVDEVLEHFRCRKPVRRFWVSAIDPASIKKGLVSLRENRDYAGMRDAARGRSRADWLLGMNLSRAYTLTGDGSLIAVGRVQTPTLAMVARRDYAVRHFVPVPYLAISATVEKDAANFRAKWRPKAGQVGLDEEGKLLIDLDLGRALVERLAKEKTARVLSCDTKRKRQYPPKAYSLADIQVEANRLYGFTAEETLKICQSLYETHKVTSYPRTDSSYLPESQHAEAPIVLAAVARTYPATAKAVEKVDTTLKSPTFNDNKVTAHHGIVPVANTVEWTKLSQGEQKLYRLIAKRYIAQFFPTHEYDETTAILQIADATFVAKGKIIVIKGWKVLYEKPKTASSVEPSVPCKPSRTGVSNETDATKEKSEEENAETAQTLPPLQAGDIVTVLGVEGREDQTKPPAYFTEGTLIAAMETIWKSFDDPVLQEKLKEAGGIGTPATRAAIIKELKRKTYLETEGKKLHCTDSGRKVLLRASSKVRSAVMTARFEAKLQGVEKGSVTLDEFVAEYEDFVRTELEGILAARRAGKTATTTPSDHPSDDGTSHPEEKRPSNQQSAFSALDTDVSEHIAPVAPTKPRKNFARHHNRSVDRTVLPIAETMLSTRKPTEMHSFSPTQTDEPPAWLDAPWPES